MPGDIENMALENELADVVPSNFVLNPVPDKNGAFSKTFSSLKSRWRFQHFGRSFRGSLPPVLREDAEVYARCAAELSTIEDYLFIIREAGFENITLQKTINLPDTVLKKYRGKEEIDKFR